MKKKRLINLYEKENVKPELQPMIENFQDELYLLENKQLEGEESSKTFLKEIERQNLENQTISKLYTDDDKSNILENILANILAPWMLLLEQEPYLSYMKKVIKKILQTTDSYTTILKNRL